MLHRHGCGTNIEGAAPSCIKHILNVRYLDASSTHRVRRFSTGANIKITGSSTIHQDTAIISGSINEFRCVTVRFHVVIYVLVNQA